jgi:hypothetical protein
MLAHTDIPLMGGIAIGIALCILLLVVAVRWYYTSR